MANISCPVFVPCPDSPILNLSAEDPDVFYWPGYFYPQPCRQILCPPTFYSKDCFGVVYSATSQADADALAQQASVNCDHHFDTAHCTNEAQTATVTCANGTPVSFTCPAGTFAVTLQGTFAACQDAANAQALAFAQQQASLLAQRTCVSLNPQCSITTDSVLPGCDVGVSYAKQLTANITGFPVVWSVVSGTLPPGLSMNSSGTITGTPTTSGIYQFSVKASTSSIHCTKQFSITITCISGDVPPECCVNGTINVTLTAHLSHPVALWTPSLLPNGITLTTNDPPTTATLHGTPFTTGQFGFNIDVVDIAGNSCQKSYTLNVIDIYPASPSMASGAVGSVYSATISTDAWATTPLTWQVTGGTLPAGLTLNPTTGVISGMPSSAGTYNFTVTLQTSAP